MFKFLMAMLAALTLGGCANFEANAKQTARFLVALNQPQVSSYDSTNAQWVRDARATVSLRTPRFFAGTLVARELALACQQGKLAEVLVYAGGAAETQALAGTCVRVFVSDNPDLARGFDTLLLDGDTVVIEGRMVAVVNQDSRQEYFYRQHVKQFAQPLN
jgi:hypothetical protein